MHFGDGQHFLDFISWKSLQNTEFLQQAETTPGGALSPAGLDLVTEILFYNKAGLRVFSGGYAEPLNHHRVGRRAVPRRVRQEGAGSGTNCTPGAQRHPDEGKISVDPRKSSDS